MKQPIANKTKSKDKDTNKPHKPTLEDPSQFHSTSQERVKRQAQNSSGSDNDVKRGQGKPGDVLASDSNLLNTTQKDQHSPDYMKKPTKSNINKKNGISPTSRTATKNKGKTNRTQGGFIQRLFRRQGDSDKESSFSMGSKVKGDMPLKRRNKQRKAKNIQSGLVEIDDQSGVLCKLCNKELPILFFKNEDLIKRMPERNLTPFLQAMKTDLFNKAPYLKYLKVSSKFIRPCNCKSPVHIYCITAQVIRNGCVYCQKCKSQYKLFLKEEQICSRKLITLAGLYVLAILVCMLGFSGLVIVDSFAKFAFFKDNPEAAAEVSLKNVFMGLDVLPDYENQEYFHLINSVRWGALLPFAIVIVLVMTWLLYFTFNDDVLARKKVVYAEIRPKEEDISRTQSKINLNILIETNKKRKNLNYLFDKLWYEKREEVNHTSQNEGFVFDQQGMIASTANFKSSQKGLEDLKKLKETTTPSDNHKNELNIIMEENEFDRSNRADNQGVHSFHNNHDSGLIGQPMEMGLEGQEVEHKILLQRESHTAKFNTHFRNMRSASIVSFGQFSNQSKNSSQKDYGNEKSSHIYGSPMKFISSSALLTKASKLTADNIVAPQSEPNFGQAKVEQLGPVNGENLSKSVEMQPLPPKLNVKANSGTLPKSKVFQGYQFTRKDSAVAEDNSTSLSPKLRPLDLPYTFNAAVNTSHPKLLPLNDLVQPNNSSRELIDAIGNELSQTISEVPKQRVTGQLDISLTPTQHNLPDFDDLSAINTSILINTSTITHKTQNSNKSKTLYQKHGREQRAELEKIQEGKSSASSMRTKKSGISMDHVKRSDTNNNRQSETEESPEQSGIKINQHFMQSLMVAPVKLIDQWNGKSE